MSLKTVGCSCARCKAYLFTEDDIVYCPECGAPHHRECYNALGHCALESLHGTEQQYSKEKEQEIAEELAKKQAETQREAEQQDNTVVKCSMCGEEYDKQLPQCPNCRTPNMLKFSGFAQIDFLGGVPADYKLDEDVTADSAKRFVAVNTQRYIPKFAELNKNNKLSWNWAAFLFPCGWMMSRKLFKNGIITGIFTVMASILSYPLYFALESIVLPEKSSYMEIFTAIYEKLPEIGVVAIILFLLSFLADIAIRVVSALFADYSYKCYTIKSIKKIQLESDDMERDYRKMGGVNIYWFLLAFLATQYIPSIIVAFL